MFTLNDKTASGVEFVAPREVRTREFGVDVPDDGEVLVDASLSVVSSGTEKLVYRGEMPTAEAYAPHVGELSYPTRYGYSVIGEVSETGSGTEVEVGQRVHVMHPHQSQFTVPTESVRPVPDGLGDEQAVHLPNTETAVSFVMDGRPIVGERVAVFGQGVVGLLTTAVLSSFPVEVVTFDPVTERRNRSEEMGADDSYHPEVLDSVSPEHGYDLVYEISGNATVLDTAVGAAGHDGRVVVGSWYGTEPTTLSLGVSFHGENVTVSDSQVTELAPELRGRWTKDRRLEATWDFVAEASGLTAERFGIGEAATAYDAVDSGDLCVVFDYQ